MGKILSQAGNSLADIYDVRGSIAGIDILETKQLPLVHEAGATVFSERFATDFDRFDTGNIAQNITFEVIRDAAVLPGGVLRLLNIQMYSDVAARLLHLSLNVRSPISPVTAASQEINIWNWDGTSNVGRFDDLGVIITVDMLVPAVGLSIPTFFGGADQANPSMVSELAMRGVTTGFGAGTVYAACVLHFAHAFIPGTRSRGLPIPSW